MEGKETNEYPDGVHDRMAPSLESLPMLYIARGRALDRITRGIGLFSVVQRIENTRGLRFERTIYSVSPFHGVR